MVCLPIQSGSATGLLEGKQAVIINTHGKSNAEYKATGMDKALLLTSDEGIYTYCGLEIKKHFFLTRPTEQHLKTSKNGKRNTIYL